MSRLSLCMSRFLFLFLPDFFFNVLPTNFKPFRVLVKKFIKGLNFVLVRSTLQIEPPKMASFSTEASANFALNTSLQFGLICCEFIGIEHRRPKRRKHRFLFPCNSDLRKISRISVVDRSFLKCSRDNRSFQS